MRRIHILYILFIVLSPTVFWGCGSGGLRSAGIHEKSGGEEIDPFAFGDEFAQPNIGDKKGSVNYNNELTNDSGDDKGIQNSFESSNSYPDSPEQNGESISDVLGYRVQIEIFEEKESADKMANFVRSKIDLKVYVEFGAPFYRVWVGDFRKIEDAEEYVKILKDKGFNKSRWIRTKINTQ